MQKQIVEKLKGIWGVGSSKGFRIGAWVVAFGVFVAWQNAGAKQISQYSDDDVKLHNKKIVDVQKS